MDMQQKHRNICMKYNIYTDRQMYIYTRRYIYLHTCLNCLSPTYFHTYVPTHPPTHMTT